MAGYIVVFFIGIAIGVAAVYLTGGKHENSGHGYFKLTPVDEDGDFYTVNVAITPSQDLLHVDTIILKKDKTQR